MGVKIITVGGNVVTVANATSGGQDALAITTTAPYVANTISVQDYSAETTGFELYVPIPDSNAVSVEGTVTFSGKCTSAISIGYSMDLGLCPWHDSLTFSPTIVNISTNKNTYAQLTVNFKATKTPVVLSSVGTSPSTAACGWHIDGTAFASNPSASDASQATNTQTVAFSYDYGLSSGAVPASLLTGYIHRTSGDDGEGSMTENGYITYYVPES